MKDIKDLKEKYPKILKDWGCDPRTSCMAFGIEVNSGWYDLLDNLMHDLQWNTDKNGYPQVIAEQIKEKYGTLRFYYTYEAKNVDPRHDGVIEGMIDFAETMSGKICEQCGDKGETKNKYGWWSTVCSKCDK